MTVAFLVLAHEQPELLARLWPLLPGPVLVHLDARVRQADFPAGPTYLQSRMASARGSWNLTLAMRELLQSARQSLNPDLYLFLSGRDYPIKPLPHLLNWLQARPDTNFLSFYQVRPGTMQAERVLGRWFWKRRYPLPPWRGSQWMALCRPTVEYLLDHPSEVFRNLWGSDELHFHTLIMNSPEAERCWRLAEYRAGGPWLDEIQANLHYVDWDPRREDPAILQDHDWDRLRATPAFFARKFCSVRSAALLDRIDAELLSESPPLPRSPDG